VRGKICVDTIKRSPGIIQAHVREGASAKSTFISRQLPPLDQKKCPAPDAPKTAVEVLNADAFTAARNIVGAQAEAMGKVAVLNLASDKYPGGGWTKSLSTTQVSTPKVFIPRR
jgi:hypothetical protein